jgi:DnaJ-class molecular chaperone
MSGWQGGAYERIQCHAECSECGCGSSHELPPGTHTVTCPYCGGPAQVCEIGQSESVSEGDGREPCWACEGRGSSIHTYGPNCGQSESVVSSEAEPSNRVPIGPNSGGES